MSYRIFTDSGSDIKPAKLAEWGVSALSLTFRFDGEEGSYADGELPIKEFYDAMRAGKVAKTAAINSETFKDAFRAILESGEDLLYLGFSSGLSSTYNSARMAADELCSEFPERTIITIDTLCASAGQGLIVYLAAKKRDEGATVEECAEYARELVPALAHWFTVEDLVYLKRGGRVSAASAFFGNLLGIKPVLHVDDAGKLVAVSKVRGRRTSLMALADNYGRTAKTPSEGVVFISCADCYDEANMLADELKKRYGVEVQLITDVGAVIGSHSGPGTMALFFIANER